MSEELLPDFDHLPILEGLGLRHAWGVFGPDDQLGTINLLTASRVKAALSEVASGHVVSLTQSLTALDPPFYGREMLQHSVFRVDKNYWDDRLDNFQLQSSTHWDGLRHVQAREFGFWGGVTDESQVAAESGLLGIDHWARHGIVGRGVLLDLVPILTADDAGYDPFQARSISTGELNAACAQEGVSVQIGDILCVRTGWTRRYLELNADGRREVADSHAFAGLAAGEEMARWLWNHHVAAVACDNPAVEVSPGSREVGSLHRRVLPLLGLALGELFDLDALTEACRSSGRWHFLFVSIPLNLVGGVGSPANAIAIL